MLAILILGAASGFPNQITESALQAWLKDTGATNTTIGILSYVALPYLLKSCGHRSSIATRCPCSAAAAAGCWRCSSRSPRASRVFALQNPAASLAPIAACAHRHRVLLRHPGHRHRRLPHRRLAPSERGLAAAATNLGYRAGGLAGLGVRADRRGPLRLAAGVPGARARHAAVLHRHLARAAVPQPLPAAARCASRWWNR